MYIGGCFLNLDGQFVRTIAKWDGANWSTLGTGLFGGSPGGLATTGSELFVGGDFTGAGDKSASRIAMWHIPHPLAIQRAQDAVTLSWPATGTNFLLEACADLGQTNWQGVAGTPVIVNDQCVVTNALGHGHQFYRLRRK